MKSSRLLAVALFGASFFLSSSVTVREARAGEESFGSTVLGCYHPGATFSSATYTRGRDRHAWTGWIKFREGRHEGYAMSFQMDMKTTRSGETFYRVLPVMDDGMEPAASGCYLREWQRY
jgi:hypothetical protein